MHKRHGHADAAKHTGEGEPGYRDPMRNAPQILIGAVPGRASLRVNRRCAQQHDKRKQDHKIADPEPQRGVAPAGLLKQQVRDVGHQPLSERAARGDDSNREALARTEPAAGERHHRREQAGETECADPKAHEVQRPQFALPAQSYHAERDRDRAEQPDAPRAHDI